LPDLLQGDGAVRRVVDIPESKLLGRLRTIRIMVR